MGPDVIGGEAVARGQIHANLPFLGADFVPERGNLDELGGYGGHFGLQFVSVIGPRRHRDVRSYFNYIAASIHTPVLSGSVRMKNELG